MMVGVVTTKPKLEQWKNDRKDQTDKNIARAEKEIELLKPQPSNLWKTQPRPVVTDPIAMVPSLANEVSKVVTECHSPCGAQ